MDSAASVLIAASNSGAPPILSSAPVSSTLASPSIPLGPDHQHLELNIDSYDDSDLKPTLKPVPLPLSSIVAYHDHDDGDAKPPQKRAETWSVDEIKAIISYRVELEREFSTHQSNKHLWEQISQKMIGCGYHRTAANCMEKWRNLLKQHWKAKRRNKLADRQLSVYRDLDDWMLTRKTTGKLLKDVQTAASTEVKPDTSLTSKTIVVKCGHIVRRVGVEASDIEIKETIRSCFGIRNRRPFWLEDDAGTVWPFNTSVPNSSVLTLVLDPGVTVQICDYDEDQRPTGHAFAKTFYCDEDFQHFLSRRGWTSVRNMEESQDIMNIEDLAPGGVYHRGGLHMETE